MSLPPIDQVTWFLHQHPNLKAYLQQKEVDLQRIKDIEVSGRHMTALIMDGITIGEATITVTMLSTHQQTFTVSAKEVQRLLSPLQG